ncbi:MAG: hypothetical protein IJM98_07395 [Oscillospiraceae bacterium]|nr:hypothetical protein [Oscillospiraceae bacterium]MBQ2795520.1 hypothetical protein [Oscillospiraceae bacterium]MBQ3235955.1 hypothetical protein [Oscillospiraceae bacterium]MBQ3561044.1 hypothetical protein [Oscillospiraceae bacterium]MBQ6700475.1 hypothetical protein [Oscillospiraceae bacterium]
MNFNLTPEQQNALLSAASQKLGISREKLEYAAKNNDLGVFGNIAAPKIQHYANSPQELERFLSDPKNQAIIKKLIGGG